MDDEHWVCRRLDRLVRGEDLVLMADEAFLLDDTLVEMAME